MADYKDYYDFLRQESPEISEKRNVAMQLVFDYEHNFGEERVVCSVCECLIGRPTVSAMRRHRDVCVPKWS